MSKQLAVLGSPISHSKSPAIHAAAYRVLNQNFEYSKIQVEKNHLMQFVETLDPNWLGLSVTAPLKNEAFRLSRNSDEISRLTGASNTLLRSNEGWDAFNTDVFGIQKALAEAGSSAKVTGVDATSEAIAEITAGGNFLATIEQPWPAILDTVIGYIVTYQKDGSLPATNFETVGTTLVNKVNAAKITPSDKL